MADDNVYGPGRFLAGSWHALRLQTLPHLVFATKCRLNPFTGASKDRLTEMGGFFDGVPRF
jgi:hypothetical protein